MIFEGGAGHAQTVAGLQAGDDLGGVGAGVFDVLGFVEDDAVVGSVGEGFGVAAEEGIRGEDQFGIFEVIEVFVALVAMKGEGAEVGSEPGGFIEPVGEDGGGADDQGGSIESALFLFEEDMGEGLDGFTEAHIVGEDATEVELAKELDPTQAIDLVGTQGGAEPEGRGDGSGLGRLPESIGEGFEIGMGFPLPIGGLGKVAELDGAEAMDGEATGGVEGAGGVKFHQGGEDGAEAIDRERDAATVGEGDEHLVIRLAFGEGLGVEGVEVLAKALEEDGEQVDFLVADADTEFEVEPVGVGMFIGMEVPAIGTVDGTFEAGVGFDFPTGGLELGQAFMEEPGQGRVTLRMAGPGVLEVASLEWLEVMDGRFQSDIDQDLDEALFLREMADDDLDGGTLEAGDLGIRMGRWEGDIAVFEAGLSDKDQEAIGTDFSEGMGGLPPLQAAGGKVEGGDEGGLLLALEGDGFGEGKGRGAFLSSGEAGADGIDLKRINGGAGEPCLHDGGWGLVFGGPAFTERSVDVPGWIEEEDVGGGRFGGQAGLQVAGGETVPIETQRAGLAGLQGWGIHGGPMTTAGIDGGLEGEVTSEALEGEDMVIGEAMRTAGQGQAGDEGVLGGHIPGRRVFDQVLEGDVGTGAGLAVFLDLGLAARELQHGMTAMGNQIEDEEDPIRVGLWRRGEGFLGCLEQVEPGFDGRIPVGARGFLRRTGPGWGVGGGDGG